MPASLVVDLGPCDDEAHLFLNGARIVSAGLGEERRFRRDLVDGEYRARLQVVASEGWAWRAKLRLVVDGQVVADVESVADEAVASCGTRQAYEREWHFVVAGGHLAEF